MERYEKLETIDPMPDAMVRSFTCYLCGKEHLQRGRIVQLWLRPSMRLVVAAFDCYVADVANVEHEAR